MGHKKEFDKLRTERMLDKLEYETAKEMGLGEEHQQLQQKMDHLEKTKCKVEAGEEALEKESARKAIKNIREEIK
ncbi:MAG: small acid-soluble spore protein [Firmicutes bacterium]|nr:small acid-soluble spore protein [Bacillota bacterium]